MYSIHSNGSYSVAQTVLDAVFICMSEKIETIDSHLAYLHFHTQVIEQSNSDVLQSLAIEFFMKIVQSTFNDYVQQVCQRIVCLCACHLC